METQQITRADLAEGFAQAAELGELDTIRALLLEALPLSRRCDSQLVCDTIVAVERVEHLARRLSVQLVLPEDQAYM